MPTYDKNFIGPVITGTDGDDQITGTDFPDEIHALAGNDVVDAKAGNDIVHAGAGADIVYAGAGEDFVEGGDGDDIIHGGAGDDLLHGDAGNDTIFGEDGNDILQGHSGDDYLDGGAGNDDLEGNDGDDTLLGGDGDDILRAGADNDYLDGGEGADILLGDAGDDTLVSNAGDDRSEGGQGSDTFIVGPGNHIIIGGEDADGTDIDTLDLSGAGNHKVIYSGPEAGIVEFYDDQGNLTHTATFSEIERVICFTPGTGIATMTGERPVEDLRVGDRVFTRDNGAQEIIWVGRKKITLGAGTLSQKMQPIRIAKGALGHGLPERDILVSPNHRVLVNNKTAQLYFAESEVLVAAKHLVGMPGITHNVAAEVEYVHFLCENHEIVLSDGAWTETFQPGDYSMGALGEAQRKEILTLFPELRSLRSGQAFDAARRTLKRYEAELLAVSGR